MSFAIPLKPQPAEFDEDLQLFPGNEAPAPAASADEAWLNAETEGQLAVDVFETDSDIVIRSVIAGVNPDDLEVFVHNDMLTIRGQRHTDEEGAIGRLIVSECHWGSFSRTLILPSEIDADKIIASLNNGILTVRLPKIIRNHRINVQEN